MDYNMLLDLATDLGYELAMTGAETFRVEESMSRVLSSYHVPSEVMAMPNYLIVSIMTENGKPITRMRRIGYHGNDLDGVEKLNALSRAICNRCPSPEDALDWLDMVRRSISRYSLTAYLLGHFLGASGFCILFGCSGTDTLWAGICGIVGGLVNRAANNLKINPFFSTLAAAFLMGMLGYFANGLGWIHNVDSTMIGALMVLVPGLLFVNAMRDIIYGDTNSGVNRIVQVLLIAAAMALGTAVAWNTISDLWRTPISTAPVSHPLWFTCIASVIGCVGFSILFNIHGPGGILCAIGGVVSWMIFSLSVSFGSSELVGYFWGSFFASCYAEIMARVRKYPAISYLVVAIFPLIPGAGIYRTMYYAVHGDMNHFASQGMYTAAIAGVMAVGILLISTLVRGYYTQKKAQKAKIRR